MVRVGIAQYSYICLGIVLTTAAFLRVFNVTNSMFYDLEYVAMSNNEPIFNDYRFVKDHLPPSASFLRRKNESDIAFCTVSVPRPCALNKNILDRTVSFLKYSIANDQNTGVTASIDVYDVTKPEKYHETAYEVERDPMVPVHHLFKNAHNHNQSCDHFMACETRDYFQALYGCSHDFHGKYIVLLEDDTVPAPKILSFISDMDAQIMRSDWKPFYVKLCTTTRYAGFGADFSTIFMFTLLCIFTLITVVLAYHKLTATTIVLTVTNPRLRTAVVYGVLTAATLVIIIVFVGKQNIDSYKVLTGEMPTRSDVYNNVGVFGDRVPRGGTQAILYPVAVARRLSESYCASTPQPDHASDPLILGDPFKCIGGPRAIDMVIADIEPEEDEVRKLYYPNLFQHAGFACSSLINKKNTIFSETFNQFFGASGVPDADKRAMNITGDCSCTTSTLLAYLLMIAVAGFVVKHYMSPYKKSDVFSK